jgi:hypothetical protein
MRLDDGRSRRKKEMGEGVRWQINQSTSQPIIYSTKMMMVT